MVLGVGHDALETVRVGMGKTVVKVIVFEPVRESPHPSLTGCKSRK